MNVYYQSIIQVWCRQQQQLYTFVYLRVDYDLKKREAKESMKAML